MKQTNDALYSQTKFVLENGVLFTNTFNLKLDQDKVLAYRYRDGDWVDFRSQPANCYPTSAYPLLLPKVGIKPYTFIAIRESDDAILGETTLAAGGTWVTETRNGQVTRRFTMKDGLPVTIDWGGSLSHLCRNAREAVKGSEVVFASRL